MMRFCTDLYGYLRLRWESVGRYKVGFLLCLQGNGLNRLSAAMAWASLVLLL
jgi:hypothetical protein